MPVHCTLHTPKRAVPGHSNVGVIFIASGVRSRRGPSRLYVRFARRLCEVGYPVLRYDPAGIGDSPGAPGTSVFKKKEFLDCTESVVNAIDYLQVAAGVERVAMAGLCGGAYSALTASVAEPRVEFLMLSSLPMQDVGGLSEDWTIDIAVESYLYKILDWRAWCKFLTGRSRYDWILRGAIRLLTGKYDRPKPDQALWEAYREYIAGGRKVLLVYGTQDPHYPPYAKHYHKKLRRLEGFESCCHVHVVQNANHTFTQMRWQKELIDTSLWWLDTALQADGQARSRGQAGVDPTGEIAVSPH